MAVWVKCAMRETHCVIPLQKTAGGILLPKGPPKANSDAHFGTVGAHLCAQLFQHRVVTRRCLNHAKLFCHFTQVIAMGSEVDLPLKKGDAIVYQKYAMVRLPSGERSVKCVRGS